VLVKRGPTWRSGMAAPSDSGDCERRESRARRGEPGWRAAVLDERAKRVRKAAANGRKPQRAERAMKTERAEAFFPLRATTN
jgi:hypothetical protein